MKRGKDDDKIMGPMFPRLHVNDTERGGPRAPPRNKMALYEQLSVPSQRFKPAVVVSASNPKANSSSVPPVSSSQSRIPERQSISPLHVPQAAAPHWGEKFIACQSEGISLNAPSAHIEQRNKVGDDVDFAVPVFVSSIRGPCSLRTKNGVDGEKITGLEQVFQVQHTRNCNKDTTGNSSLCTGFRKDVTDPNEDIGQECSRREQFKSATDLATTRKRGRASEEENTSDNIDCQEDSSSRVSRLPDVDDCLRQESKSAKKSGDNGSINAVESVRSIGIRVFPQQEGDICVEDPGSPYEANGNTERLGDSVDGAEQLGNSDKSDDGSKTSMLDSLSGLDISPDDVVATIGQKHFWKARRAIVNQQRVFAVQVFELHRLIKVQKLIAESPQILLEDSDYLGKDPFKAPPAKKLQGEYFVKPLPQIKGGEDSEKLSHVLDCRMEYAVGKASLSSVQNSSHPSGYGPYNGTLPSVLVGNDGKPNPWSFHHSPRHQWLIPVMSPTEGLVYNPYPGPGFAGNVCGGCGPFGASMAGNYMIPAYGVPAPHYQGLGSLPGAPLVSQTYFPRYGMPAMNPANSGSAVDQMPGSHNLSAQSAGGVNLNIQHQSSCNLPSTKNGATQHAKLTAAKDTELQGSTASSPSDRVQGDAAGNAANALQLFPIDPNAPEGGAAEPNDIDHRMKVIRVVPHNPRSATASAARIFQSIQEERKQYDSV